MVSQNRSRCCRLLLSVLLVLAVPGASASPPTFSHGESQESQQLGTFDWKQRAVEFDRLAFDEHASGPYLPLLSWHEKPRRHFTLPSYVGMPSDGEAICCLAAVMSGSLAGIDKTQDRGVDWVEACEAWFSGSDKITLNNVGARNAGGSFWYAVLPGVLHAQLALRYPRETGLNAKLRAMADRYREVARVLGGPNADFNHTGFDFAKNQPVDNGKWKEPDAAAGIAYIEYAAWTTSHDDKYLETARWCLDSLERRKWEEGSPLYETLLYYAPALAAKMNAEHGTHYDVSKLLEWCLGENAEAGVARPHWGVLTHRFGDADLRGLQGSTRISEGYAFAMNTFNAAAALAPLARYDQRFASRIAKWLTEVEVNARRFFADEVPLGNQSNPELRGTPLRCVPYEGIRESARVSLPWTFDGVRVGAVADEPALTSSNERVFRCGEDGALRAIYEVPLPALYLRGHWQIEARVAKAGVAFRVKTAPSPNGPWQPAGGFTGPAPYTDGRIAAGGPLPEAKDFRKLWLAIEATGEHAANEVLMIQRLKLFAALAITPWSSGDAFTDHRGPTDLASYGGAYIGYFAALTTSSKTEVVNCFDLSATDFLSQQEPRVLLYFNPSTEIRTLTFDEHTTCALQPQEATVHGEAH